MISVAMTTYNSEKYIIKQLDSMVNQSVNVDEVIIIDDCSKDDTVYIIEQYIRDNNLENWRIIRNKENLGYIKSFYKSIKRTNGDIVILSDHDDEWEYDKVKIISDAFARTPGMLALATSFRKIDGDSMPIVEKKIPMRSNNNLIRRSFKEGSLNHVGYKDVATFNLSPGCCCAFSSSIKEVFLKKLYNIPHDWKINLIAAAYDGLYYLDVVTTRYRIHSNNTIGLGHKLSYDERRKVIEAGYKEKVDMYRLMKDIGASDEIKDYFKEICKAFYYKVKFFEDPSIERYARCFTSSFGKSRLYESLVIDLVSCTVLRK